MKRDEIARSAPTAKVDAVDDRPEVGDWFWVPGHRGCKEDREAGQDRSDREGKLLGCIVEVGSNYAKFEGVGWTSRESLDHVAEECVAESNPDEFIQMKLGYHKGRVRELMGEIKRVCAQLGVPMNAALAASTESSTTALAVAHGVDDVKAHKRALVKAKEKTLPELFKKVEEQHKAMSTWMKAELIPAKAELSSAEAVTEAIEGKIHTVELYAGLQEDLVQVRDGDAAEASTKVTLVQTRHYMDEECLVKYEAGGMDFKSIKDFDRWVARDENMFRLLPHARCVVAFRVRRADKKYGGEVDTLSNHIKFWQYNQANKHTYLYIRNGHQLWRMDTSTEFDEELFPSHEDSKLLSNAELWIKESEYDISHDAGIISARTRDGMIEGWRATRDYVAQCVRQWRRAGKPDKSVGWKYVAVDHPDEQYRWEPGTEHETKGDPRSWPNGICENDTRAVHNPAWRQYVRLTPESIYHDDVMKKVQKAAMAQNRVAVVLQGLLDRSTCLHPHPPWRIWTPEGFAAGVELVYTTSRAITAGEAPDFDGYLKQLNRSLKVGCHTIGQKSEWAEAMHDKYGEDWKSYRNEALVGDGPKRIDVVHKIWRDGSLEYAFTRDRKKPKLVQHPEKRGYLQASYPDIPMKWRSGPTPSVMCLEAYTPGDFHIFFDDPRTRAEYLQWAPFLLTAEDWHHDRREAEVES